MTTPAPTLLSLATTINTLTQAIIIKLTMHNVPEPTFTSSTDHPLWQDPTLDLNTTKARLVDAATSLTRLVAGPLTFHREVFGSHFDLAALQVMLEHRVYDQIPLGGGCMTLSELGERVGLDPAKLARMLRLLATLNIAEEVEDGVFRHTAFSEVLVRDRELRAQVEMQRDGRLDEMHKASVETANYFKEYPAAEESHLSPFKYRWGTPFYEWYEKNPEKGVRFALAQEGIAKLDRSSAALVEWIKSSGHPEGRLIDVGGGSGHVALELAKQFPTWSFTVQDISETMFSENSQCADPSLLSRVEFSQHDFFQPQPVVPEDVKAWYIRSCLHNWGDDDCVRVLRQFAPALEARPECSVLINESIVPARGTVPLREEHLVRQVDVAMMVIANSKQRSEQDFRDLIVKADRRYEVVRIIRLPGTMGVIEFKLRK
ncbi:sterigmatocystin 8-O-methyltransferase precursor [Aspergillus luchuensis IFO 4308]|nr:sterigmatocystin 8-O-methyltransferase precursor [Aspergillus luchuensis IFO 4308]